MRITNILLVVISVFWLQGCGTMVLQSPNKTENLPVTYDLDIAILLVKEAEYASNSISVDYEIKNNSPVLFKPNAKKYVVFFSIITEDGREIGHYKNLYKNIAPNSSIILDETINLSVYKYKSIKATIYIE
tara:strand:- start:1629 stop:2021 length:393 start_codon:yes stop_codon:yes gene_type:complete